LFVDTRWWKPIESNVVSLPDEVLYTISCVFKTPRPLLMAKSKLKHALTKLLMGYDLVTLLDKQKQLGFDGKCSGVL